MWLNWTEPIHACIHHCKNKKLQSHQTNKHQHSRLTVHLSHQYSLMDSCMHATITLALSHHTNYHTTLSLHSCCPPVTTTLTTITENPPAPPPTPPDPSTLQFSHQIATRPRASRPVLVRIFLIASNLEWAGIVCLFDCCLRNCPLLKKDDSAGTGLRFVLLGN